MIPGAVGPCQSLTMRMVMIAVALAACTDNTPRLAAGSDDPCATNIDEVSCEATATPGCMWIGTICATHANAMGLWPGSGAATCTCPNGELCVTGDDDNPGIWCQAASSCGAVDPGFCSESEGVNNLCVCTTV
jgi:hypothetical protein